VPANAKVYIDGELTNLSAGKRVFQTPDLIPGHLYFYDLRVEVSRGGQTLAETQRVILRPGQMATAAFPNLNRDGTAAVVPASQRAELQP
jgi:uncharacterized protein (TIGR03000 family)